jgi:hypothetical protein
MTWVFVTKNDFKSMEEKGIDFNNEYPVFLTEFHNYLKSVWPVSYCHWITPLQNGNIEQFNANIGYPSNDTYYMLEDSFTAVSDEDMNLLSNNTMALIGYFYNIHLYSD